jgi:Tol biopolymer transport system component
VNLETGKVDRGVRIVTGCTTLSPDNRTLAGEIDGRLTLQDARTGKLIRRGRDIGPCVSLGWSPDGRLLAADSNVFDQQGRIVARLPRGHAVNQNMSWSPDGRSLLLYDETSGRHLVRDVLGGSESALNPPAKVARTLGWVGSRVVWLVGLPGDQRLVATDRTGANPQLWMDIQTGDRAIATVQWSWDISGRPVSGR